MNTLRDDLRKEIDKLASIDNPSDICRRALALAESALLGGEYVLMRTALVFARAAYADWLARKGVQS